MKKPRKASQFSVRTKRGEARVETRGICAGQPFGLNKAARRLAA